MLFKKRNNRCIYFSPNNTASKKGYGFLTGGQLGLERKFAGHWEDPVASLKRVQAREPQGGPATGAEGHSQGSHGKSRVPLEKGTGELAPVTQDPSSLLPMATALGAASLALS